VGVSRNAVGLTLDARRMICNWDVVVVLQVASLPVYTHTVDVVLPVTVILLPTLTRRKVEVFSLGAKSKHISSSLVFRSWSILPFLKLVRCILTHLPSDGSSLYCCGTLPAIQGERQVEC
jgi:hypothetical protein